VGKDKPVPNITLGKDVTCSAPSVVTALVTITSPTENEVLSTGLPTFRGKAPIGKTIQIEVRSAPITGSVKADVSGNWVWPVPRVLDPGDHVLTLSYTDDAGSTKSIIRNFSVKAETSILPQTYGTPSAGVRLSPTPTPKPVVVNKSAPPVTGARENVLVLLTAGMFLITLGLSTVYQALFIDTD
jgi:hypothetical protein